MSPRHSRVHGEKLDLTMLATRKDDCGNVQYKEADDSKVGFQNKDDHANAKSTARKTGLESDGERVAHAGITRIC